MDKNTGNTQVSAQIQEVLQKMRHTYIENLPQQLDKMEALVMELKKGVDYPNSYETLYRAIHSLKGTAGTYGIHIISTVCHHFEGYLKANLKDGAGARDQHIGTCLDFTDLLRNTLNQVASGRESFPEIEASLSEI
jgi:chemotaxis protein histidine kinase CheA